MLFCHILFLFLVSFALRPVSWQFSFTLLYSWVEINSMRVENLAKEHRTTTLARIWTLEFDPDFHSSTNTTVTFRKKHYIFTNASAWWNNKFCWLHLIKNSGGTTLQLISFNWINHDEKRKWSSLVQNPFQVAKISLIPKLLLFHLQFLNVSPSAE